MNFYPRSPRGERRCDMVANKMTGEFLSTLPARGATGSSFQKSNENQFLSTLPARGATRLSGEVTPNSFFNFYPRSPRGERLVHFAV